MGCNDEDHCVEAGMQRERYRAGYMRVRQAIF